MALRLQHAFNQLPVALGFLGVAMAVLSLVNLSGHAQPLLDLNESIIDDLGGAASLPVDAQMQQLVRLRDEQEKALGGMPAEPFAWARLSYLRLATTGDKAAAFAALRISNLVSPDEPRQLPERAFMWRQLSGAENAEEKAHQAVLWQKAFRMQPDGTWALAKQNGIVGEVAAAIKSGDRELYEEWKARQQGAP